MQVKRLISRCVIVNRSPSVCVLNEAKVNCKDECGYTPLHLAAMHDEAASMRLLLEAGVRRSGSKSFESRRQ